jgi:hypothetical protein
MNLKSSSYLEIANIWKKLSPEWSEETKEFVNELFSRLEHAELDLQVLNLRLKKQWTENSNIYTQDELDHECLLHYNSGLSDGLEQASSSRDIGFRPCS